MKLLFVGLLALCASGCAELSHYFPGEVRDGGVRVDNEACEIRLNADGTAELLPCKSRL
jgi:hypothetical protein